MTSYEYHGGFIYFIIRTINKTMTVKIGHASSLERLSSRFENHSNEAKRGGYTIAAHSVIRGGQGDEHSIHVHFRKLGLAIPDCGSDEIFDLAGDLRSYLDWIGSHPFATDNLSMAALQTYESPLQWPFHNPWSNTDGVGLFDALLPHAEKPMRWDEKKRFFVSDVTNEWYTPEHICDSAAVVFGRPIDLDPASNPSANCLYVHAKYFFTQTEGGETQPWDHPIDKTPACVFCNPPYRGEHVKFIKHGVLEYLAGRAEQIIFVLSGWGLSQICFVPLWDYPMVMHKDRLNFIGGARENDDADRGRNSTVFVYLGRNKDRFFGEFQKYGFAFEKWTGSSKATELTK